MLPKATSLSLRRLARLLKVRAASSSWPRASRDCRGEEGRRQTGVGHKGRTGSKKRRIDAQQGVGCSPCLDMQQEQP
jgi:hypothetical protein